MAQYTINNIAHDIDFECNDDAVRRTIQNAKNLLMLRIGELPYDRLRGFDTELFDLPITELNGERLMREIDRLLEWEPDATAVSADARLDDDGQIIVTCVIEVDIDSE